MPDPYSQRTAPGEVHGLLGALRVLRERWWVIAICALVAGIASVLYVEHQQKQYVASAALQFTTNSLPSQVAGVQSNQSLDPEGDKGTNVQLVTTTPVATMVVKALGLKTKPAKLLGQVTASDPQDDYIVDVAATDSSPRRAAAIANGFVNQYVAYSQAQNEAVLVNGERLINQHLAQLGTTDLVQRRNLQALSQKLLLLQAVQTANAKVVNAATVPTSPDSPKKKTTVAVALLFGALLGIGLSFMLNLIDRRVTSLDEFQELYGVPALAGIPRLPRRPQTAREREIALEPFRILHNGLSLLRSADELKTVIVTSAVASEGKTTVALELARAAAMSGQRVIVVEADVRRPSLGSRLGLNIDDGGLTSVVEHGDDPLEHLHSMPDLALLKVLPCGPPPRTATSALNPERLYRTFQLLAAHADLVVVDSAPLLPVVDTRVLLDEVGFDAYLVVARSGTTTRDEIRRARAVLDQRKLVGVGLVINELEDVSSDYYYGDGNYSPAGGGRRTPRVIDVRDTEFFGVETEPR